MAAPASKFQDPWVPVVTPEHYATGDALQISYYDTTSNAPLGEFVKLDSGAADLSTGRRTGSNFPDAGLWKQT